MPLARPHISGSRSHSVAEALAQKPWTAPAHAGTTKCVAESVLLCLQTGECVLVHFAAAGSDLTKIHLKSTGNTSSDSGGLWLRAVTECVWTLSALFVFSSQVFSCLYSSGEKCLPKQGVSSPEAPPLQNSVRTRNCWKQRTEAEKELKSKPSSTSVGLCDGKGML